jgi:hypothetical protein
LADLLLEFCSAKLNAGSCGAFAGYNRDEFFKDKNSAGLAFGSFGFRKPASISVRKTTLGLLKKLKLGKSIRVQEEPDKEAMAGMDGDALAQADAARKIKDVFFRVQSKTGRASGLRETDSETKRNPARRTVSGF